MNPTENKKVPKRIAQTILNSLKGGVVPRIGLPYIAVGRKNEIQALLHDVDIIAEGGASFCFIVGRYGSGKSFLLQTIRNYVMDRGFIVVDADLSPERRLQGTRGQGLATYRELIGNLSTKTKPEGGALTLVLDRWISSVQTQAMQETGLAPEDPALTGAVDQKIYAVTSAVSEMVHGFEFARLLSLYYHAYLEGDDDTKGKVVRWFRGEYTLKREAREDLGVNNPVSFAALINAKRDQNRALTKAYRQDHLDASLRTALFALLQSQPDHYDALLVAMIYSGLTLSELAALRFGDVRRLHLRSNDDCYCIVADKLVRKVGSRYSTISAQNDEYPIQKLRKVVLYPWAADILLQRVQELLQQGLKMPQISDMRFSDLGPACPIQGPKEIESRLVPFMRKAGIQDDVLPRTSRDGVVSASTLRVTCDLLIRDAQYVAEHLCGADSVMLHAMFGLPWTTTDEQNYLDILSDLYAVTRYFRLHRFCPFSQDTLAPRTRTVWRLTNPLQSPQTVKMRTKYGVTVAWKKATSNESN